MTEFEWREIFVERVRTILYEKNMTQTELCKLIGMSTSAMNHYLSYDKTPSVNMLLKLCNALGCTMDKLVV